jgi:hypothetical protein
MLAIAGIENHFGGQSVPIVPYECCIPFPQISREASNLNYIVIQQRPHATNLIHKPGQFISESILRTHHESKFTYLLIN